MKEFSTLFEEYMMMDKKTLAQLLAMRDYREQQDNEQQLYPYYPYNPLQPFVPSYPQPIGPYYGGDWTITCMVG